MNFSNQQKLYFNVILLFLFTFFLASKIISGFKSNNFDYFRIVIGFILLIFCVLSVIKYANKENNPK